MLSRFLLVLLFGTLSTHASVRQFVIIGDSGKDNDGQKKVAESLTSHCQKESCHFGMLAGDNIYPAGMSSANDPILDSVFQKYYAHLPFHFFVALGNHDYGKWSNSWDRGAHQLEYAKRNSQYFLPSYYYYVEFDDTVLVVLDTTRLMWDKDYEAQAAMVKEAYSKAHGKWFFVLGHHPYLSNGKHGNAGNYEGITWPGMVSGTYVKSFFEQYICNRAQLYISGHDHSLQLLDGRQRNCNTLLVVSGTGASFSKVKPNNKAYYAEPKLGFLSLITNENSLLLRFVDGTNSSHILYQMTMKKPGT